MLDIITYSLIFWHFIIDAGQHGCFSIIGVFLILGSQDVYFSYFSYGF